MKRYRITEVVNLPFQVLPTIKELGRTRMEVNVKVKSAFGAKMFALGVVIKIPVPKQIAKTSFQVTSGRAKYNAAIDCLAWKRVFEEKYQKNKDNQFELKVLHTAGSKAFRKVQYDEDGKELGLVDLYHKTHFSPKRQAWVHNETEIRLKKLKEWEKEAIEDGSGPLSDEQLSIEVFGRKSGYINGLGRSLKSTITASSRRTRAALEIENEETRRKLEKQWRINEELNARVHNLESNSVEVNAKIDLMLQQISRGGFTSNLLS